MNLKEWVKLSEEEKGKLVRTHPEPKCDCIEPSIKLHIEGALIHYIIGIRKDVVTFAEAAVEYQNTNPALSQHYLQLVESQKAFIEEIEKSKRVILALPICETESGNPHNPRRVLSVPEKHQLAIAKKTLTYSDVGARIMGGPTKEEARKIIKELTGKVAEE